MSRRVPFKTLPDLVREYVPDGQELLIGGFSFNDPVALAHEIIRQERKNLFVMKTSGGLLIDLLVGAGCVDRLLFCHVWNSVGPQPAHAFRRAVERGDPGTLLIDELSYGSYTMALAAGAWGLPFMPTTPTLGSGHDTVRRMRPNKMAKVTSPFADGRAVTVVEPITPALGVFHVQRVDRYGNGQMLGPVAETRLAIAACDRVVLIAEELVDDAVVTERPELTVVPGFMVDAVAVQPWTAHPTDCFGYYARDMQHHDTYGRLSATPDGFKQYLDEWVLPPGGHASYLQRLGTEHLTALTSRPRPW